MTSKKKHPVLFILNPQGPVLCALPPSGHGGQDGCQHAGAVPDDPQQGPAHGPEEPREEGQEE